MRSLREITFLLRLSFFILMVLCSVNSHRMSRHESSDPVRASTCTEAASISDRQKCIAAYLNRFVYIIGFLLDFLLSKMNRFPYQAVKLICRKIHILLSKISEIARWILPSINVGQARSWKRKNCFGFVTCCYRSLLPLQRLRKCKWNICPRHEYLLERVSFMK